MSSDWSDTMLDIAVTFFYHPIYMIIGCYRIMSIRRNDSSQLIVFMFPGQHHIMSLDNFYLYQDYITIITTSTLPGDLRLSSCQEQLLNPVHQLTTSIFNYKFYISPALHSLISESQLQFNLTPAHCLCQLMTN